MGMPDPQQMPFIIESAKETMSWTKLVAGGLITLACGVCLELFRRKFNKGDNK